MRTAYSIGGYVPWSNQERASVYGLFGDAVFIVYLL